MTSATITISFKAPVEIVERMPAAGNGRSRFIIEAVSEKISRKPAKEWKPTTERGRRMAAILERGKHERGPDLDDAAFEKEMQARRGGVRW